MEYKTLKQLGILIFVLQLLGIGIWFYVEQPEMVYLWDTLKISLLLFAINVLVALVFYVLKKKDISKLFLGNSVICPFIFFAYWIIWFTYYA